MNLEREFEREILDHAAFLREQEYEAQLEYELWAEFNEEDDLLGVL